MQYYVYILSNATKTVIYTGVTNDLVRRVWQHREHIDPDSFTARFDVNRLVFYEVYEDVQAAIAREKQIKKLEQETEKCACQWHESEMGGSISFVAGIVGQQRGTDCHVGPGGPPRNDIVQGIPLYRKLYPCEEIAPQMLPTWQSVSLSFLAIDVHPAVFLLCHCEEAPRADVAIRSPNLYS